LGVWKADEKPDFCSYQAKILCPQRAMGGNKFNQGKGCKSGVEKGSDPVGGRVIKMDFTPRTSEVCLIDPGQVNLLSLKTLTKNHAKKKMR